MDFRKISHCLLKAATRVIALFKVPILALSQKIYLYTDKEMTICEGPLTALYASICHCLQAGHPWNAL